MRDIARYVFSLLTGIVSLFLYVLILFVSFIAVLTVLLLAFLTGSQRTKIIQHIYYFLPVIWVNLNQQVFKKLTRTQLEIHLPAEKLNPQDFYLMTANHQSWSDILVLFAVFNQRIPMLKFFAKKQLFWLPLIGQVCWLYGFPFLHRHTQAQLKKHPEWRKKDIQATRKACERFKQRPGTLMIFAEGTRFSQEKNQKQHSNYKYLLKPKTGGLALALNCMEDRIKTLIDVTIIYPQNQTHTFWDYCAGRIKKIIVHVKAIPVPDDLRGDVENDAEFRQRFQKFVNQIWQNKDELICKIYQTSAGDEN